MRILDGGNGHLLRRLGVRIQGEIGTMQRFLNVALANRDQPSLVTQAHLAYLRAGASVITTNSYSCVPAALANAPDASPTLLAELIAAAGRIAAEARELHFKEAGGTSCLIAGCVPPLHESYRSDRVGDDDELAAGYDDLVVPSVAPYSDVLICETMSSAREGRLAAKAASKAGLPVWVAWTLSEEADGTLRSGEAVEEAVAAVAGIAHVEGMLINCSSPASVDAAIGRLKAAAPEGVKVGAYANGFATVKASGGGADDSTKGKGEYDEHFTPDAYAQYVDEWRERGAEIVGGCCGVFPEHIEAVARKLKA